MNSEMPINFQNEYVEEGHTNLEEEINPEEFPDTTNEEPCRDNTFQAFKTANQPLYEGSAEGVTKLFLASLILNMKTKHNFSASAVDDILEIYKRVLPVPSEAPTMYYEVKILLNSLGMPLQKIDV